MRRQETEFRRGLRFTVARAGKVERCRNTTNISLYFISGEPSCEKMQHPKLSLNDQSVSPWSNINLHLKKMSNLRSGSKVISSRYQSTLTGLLLMWKLLYEFQISWDETLAFNSIRSLTISANISNLRILLWFSYSCQTKDRHVDFFFNISKAMELKLILSLSRISTNELFNLWKKKDILRKYSYERYHSSSNFSSIYYNTYPTRFPRLEDSLAIFSYKERKI